MHHANYYYYYYYYYSMETHGVHSRAEVEIARQAGGDVRVSVQVPRYLG